MSTAKDIGLDRITDEAAEWFTLLRDTKVSQGDRAEFARWMAESPVHVREYLGIAEMWGALQGARPWPMQSAEELIALARTAPNVVPLPSESAQTAAARERRSPSRTPWHFASWAAAAVVLIVVSASIVIYGPIDWLRGQELTTTRGEQRSVVLSDGSVVQLNTLTRADIRFSANVRRIELREGEAFFRVAQDARRPFEVVTPFALVRAVGTEFNVYSRTHGTRVSVVEGKVRVALRRDSSPADAAPDARPTSESGTFSLGAQESAEVDARGATRHLALARPEAAIAWMQRRLVFDDAPIARVIDEFNLYNETQLRLDDSELASLRITGVFNADDPGALVKYLERVQGVTATRTAEDSGAQVTLRGSHIP